MSKVITFSRAFPSYHPKAGQPTFFVEKIWKSFGMPINSDLGLKGLKYENTHLPPKHHTIRGGNRFKAGKYFSPRVWSDKPYRSKQIIIAPDIEVKKVWDFEISGADFRVEENFYGGESENSFWILEQIASNDGLSRIDLLDWFQYPKPFSGQIICWNESINY